MTDAYTR